MASWRDAPVVEDEGQETGQPAWKQAPAAQQEDQGGFEGFASSALSGLNRGLLARAPGALVDAVNMSPMLVNLLPGEQGVGPISDNPIGGTRQMTNLLSDTGLASKDPSQSAYPSIDRGFQTVGESIPYAAAPLAAGRGVQPITKGVTAPVRESARRAPGSFAAGEASAASGAGVGAGMAYELFPGDPTAEAFGEIAGGFLSPGVMASRVAGPSVRAAKRYGKSFTSGGQRDAAADQLNRTMENYGEDPQEVAQQLQGEDVPGTDLTPGAKTGSPTLLALERSLINKNRDLRRVVDQKTAKNLEVINRELDALAGDGTPEQAQAGIRNRVDRLEQALDTRLQQAIIEARADVDPSDVPNARREANLRAREALEDALKDARQQERNLWQQVPDDVSVNTDATRRAYDEAKQSLGKAERQAGVIPDVAEKLLGRQGDQAGPNQIGDVDTVKEMRSLYSQLRESARIARSSGERNKARVADKIADAVLEDFADADVSSEVAPTFDRARTFSEMVNRKFKQGTVGRLLGSERTGGERVSPENTLEDTLGRGGARGRTNAETLRDAAGTPEGSTQAGLRSQQMEGAQEQFLRAMALRAIDDNGRVNGRALRAFLENNRDKLQDFPQLRESLGTVDKAYKRLKRFQKGRQGKPSVTDKHLARAELFTNAKPQEAMQTVFRSQDPAEGLSGLVRMARKDQSGEALKGLRTAFFKQAIDRARRTAGDKSMVDAEALRSALYDPATPGGKSLMQVAKRERLVTPGNEARLRRLLKTQQKVQDQLANRDTLADEDLYDQPAAAFDMLARMIGANIGGASATGQATGTPLVLAQAGSQTARRLMEKVPVEKMENIYIEAVKDPEAMKLLMERAPSKSRQAALSRRLNAFLIENGFIEPQDEEDQSAVRQ
jgi:hypothetical protein